MQHCSGFQTAQSLELALYPIAILNIRELFVVCEGLLGYLNNLNLRI